MMIQKSERISKAKAPDVSALKLVVSFAPREWLSFLSVSGFLKQLSYSLFWHFGVIRTSYAVTTIFMLGFVFITISSNVAVLCDGCLVLLLCPDIYVVSSGFWDLMIIGMAQCFQGYVLIDDVSFAAQSIWMHVEII
jgi:hypothetical protein